MNNFIWSISTRVCFGKGEIKRLGTEASAFGKKALLVYGGGSIKQTGIYDAACSSLSASGVSWVELSGIEPNPKIESVREGVRLCRENDVSVIIPVGGGSTIDCAKAISGSVSYDGDPWDLISGKAAYTSFVPVIAVLTLSATGSEMNHIGVISNLSVNKKLGTHQEGMRPAVSILDPEFTYSLPPFQTACGTADIMAHTLENYMGSCESAFLQDRFAESILKTCVKYGPIALADPTNYEARANLMWSGSHAINGLLSLGKGHAWTAHAIEHQVSAYYDKVAHGAGLAVLLAPWFELLLSKGAAKRLRDLAVNVWNIAPTDDDMADAKAGIAAMRDLFAAFKLPKTLREAGVEDDSKFEIMAQGAYDNIKNAPVYAPLSKDEILGILKACY